MTEDSIGCDEDDVLDSVAIGAAVVFLAAEVFFGGWWVLYKFGVFHCFWLVCK